MSIEPVSQDVLYVVSLAPEPGYEEKFNAWYDTEHLPELISCPGFKSARRYESIEGDPKYLAVYDVSSMDVFQSDEYLKLRNRGPEELSPLAREVQLHRSTVMRAMYRETLRVSP